MFSEVFYLTLAFHFTISRDWASPAAFLQNFYWYSVKEGQGLLCTAKSELTLKQKKRKQSWKSDLSMFHGEETISFWMFCR